MFGKAGKIARKITHSVWIQMQESGAIMAGTRIQLDSRETGDCYQISPLIDEDVFRADYEVSETRTIHETRRAR